MVEVVDHQLSTRRRQEQLLREYIDPALGSMQLGLLGPEQLEQFYAQLLRCRRRCDGRRRNHDCKGLANSTVREIHFMLRAASDRALRWRYISVNAAALAEPPSFKRPDPDPPSLGEVAAVLNEAWLQPDWGMGSLVGDDHRHEAR